MCSFRSTVFFLLIEWLPSAKIVNFLYLNFSIELIFEDLDISTQQSHWYIHAIKYT